MGEAMEEGTLIRWLKKEGDPVEENEAIAEVETDKAAMEIPSFVSGKIHKFLVQEGAVVPVGDPIAVILEEGESEADAEASGPKTEAAASTVPPQEEKPVQKAASEEPPAGTQPAPPKVEAAPAEASAPAPAEEKTAASADERILVSPLAKKIAHDAGVDLRAIQGTGPKGRIVEADVRDYIQRVPKDVEEKEAAETPTSRPALVTPTPVATPTPGEDRKLSAMRKTIARRLLESKQTVPHFYITTEIDMKAAKEFHDQLRGAAIEGRAKTTLADFVIKACALALVKLPDVNAQFKGDVVHYPGSVDIGYAVSVEGGLIVPVIRNCESKSLHKIAADRRPLVEKAQAGKLAPDEYAGGTFTITNMGTFDVENFAAIINPPQSAILAIASILDQVVAVDGEIQIRPRMKVTLSADHRVVDGVLAAQFLAEIKRLLQNPLSLVE
jgi:pyruvate dehydrogenase E2 component (dihydrolipoamide acetyltransferase)